MWLDHRALSAMRATQFPGIENSSTFASVRFSCLTGEKAAKLFEFEKQAPPIRALFFTI
jgi:hypothetical protein